MIYARLHEVRALRNRVAHHEPVWDRDLEARYQRMLEVLGWMNRKMVDAVSALDCFPVVLRNSPGAYRGHAERLLRGTTLTGG